MSTLQYAMFDSPVGELLALRTRVGFVRLAYDDDPADAIIEQLSERLDTSAEAADLTDERRQLDEYFAGRRKSFDIPIDPLLIPTEFGRRVLQVTGQIPYGEVSSYGEVAEHAGSPRGARAAGNALNANPVPIIVPCHRVVPSSGKSIGGYGGREDCKAFLLRLEGSIP